MHRTEHCIRKRRVPGCPAPLKPVSPASGSMPGSAPRTPSLPDGAGCSVRPFPRLQRPRLSALPFQGQRSWPAPSRPRLQASSPVRPFCSTAATGSPRLRPLPCFWPVASLLACALNCFRNLHSPFGILPPSGSKRSVASAALRPAFRSRPISVRSPPLSLFQVSSCGSTFPIRYVSGGLLFCLNSAHCWISVHTLVVTQYRTSPNGQYRPVSAKNGMM